MDDRKRSFEESTGTQSKRLRPDEILGSTDDARKATTRLLVNRTEFSKIIGKGGQTLHSIRSNSGVILKASDVSEETRVVVLTGSPKQVIDAFEVISELLRQAHGLTSPTSEPFHVEFLIEPSKVGKIVGSKGATINGIKTRSGVFQLRVQKESQDVNGVSLQSLLLEGGLVAVRRCHYYLLELFCDPSALPSISNRGDQSPPNLSVMSLGPSSKYSNPVPFANLTSYGVLHETVRQLTDMKAYLSRHFGLDLSIFLEAKEETAGPSPSREYAPHQSSAVNNHAQPPAQQQQQQQQQRHPDDIVFNIPKETVGAVIGRGGHVLKDLQAEFGFRVHLEKDENGVTRNVVIAAPSHGSLSAAELKGMQLCRDKILRIVQSHLDSDGHS